MNTGDSPEQQVSAYCQNCGKPLEAQAVRSVAGVVYCEPCLAARLSGAAPTGSAGAGSGAGASGWTTVDPRSGAAVVPPLAAAPGAGSANPVLAGFLGLIPGVGAMYNGQFIKALVHVLVFVGLVGAANDFGPLGFLVFIWIVYQVFDAAQTAAARRDGRPVPDPIGLNALIERMGIPGQPAAVGGSAFGSGPAYGTGPISGSFSNSFSGSGRAATAAYTAVPPSDPLSSTAARGDAADPTTTAGSPGATWQVPQDAGTPVGSAGFNAGAYGPVPPVYPAYAGRPDATGPIVLIIVGVLFLLSTLGIFRMHWLAHLWPVFIIVLGAGLLFRRLRASADLPPIPPVPPTGGVR